MLVQSEIPSISVMRLNRGPYKSGIRLMIDIEAARMLLSITVFTPISVTRKRFVIMYVNASRTSRRVAVPIKGILGRIWGYTKCFKKKKEVKSHSEVIAR
jgi:hypothetical protein